MGAWEDGFSAGWIAAIKRYPGAIPDSPSIPIMPMRRSRSRAVAQGRKKRAASPSQKRYGREFKRLAPKYKKKAGGWKKDGFKRCAAAARKAAKR
jgi:hypothetical protein